MPANGRRRKLWQWTHLKPQRPKLGVGNQACDNEELQVVTGVLPPLSHCYITTAISVACSEQLFKALLGTWNAHVLLQQSCMHEK